MKEENVKTAARCLKVLAHPMRLQIVAALGEKERNVQEITTSMGLSQSNVSQHVNLLKDRRVLDSRREGNQVFYRIRDKKILTLIDLMQDLFCPPVK